MSKHLSNTIRTLNRLVRDVESNIPKLSLALYLAKEEIDWKTTNYGTWRAFCKAILPFPYTDTYRYVSAAKQAIEVCKLDVHQITYIVETIGWTRFSICVHFEDAPINPYEFVGRHRYYDVDSKPKQKPADDVLEHFSFQLTQSDAEALTSLLLERGMRLSKASRVNASVAMAKLIQDVRKD